MNNSVTVLNITQLLGHLEFECYIAAFIFFEHIFFLEEQKNIYRHM